MRFEFELRRAGWFGAERIEVGGEVAIFADCLGKCCRTDDAVDRGAIRRAGDGYRCGRAVDGGQRGIKVCEESSGVGVYGRGISLIPIVELKHIAGIRAKESAQIAHE